MPVAARLLIAVATVHLALAAPHSEAAGKFDGAAPLLCVPITVMECAREADCRRVTAESVNLPQFLKVDVKAGTVLSDESKRTSPFRNIEHLDGTLLLQGGQAGRGWTMAISEETGSMSATILSAGEGFVVFGSCTLLP